MNTIFNNSVSSSEQDNLLLCLDYVVPDNFKVHSNVATEINNGIDHEKGIERNFYFIVNTLIESWVAMALNWCLGCYGFEFVLVLPWL